MNRLSRVVWILGVVCVFAGSGYANWADSFNDGEFDLTTWEFFSFPQVADTSTQTILQDADGNHYLAFEETSPRDLGGALFGGGFGSNEEFTDVRVGCVVNVAGDASHNYHGLLARTSYFIDDGSVSGYPGIIATGAYIMHISYNLGPANLSIELEKIINNENIMDEDIWAVVPNLENDRSYYVELDVVGSGPVYVTGSLYEYQGGPLVARTPTMIDTNGNDWWEDENEHDAVFTKGVSGIFAQNEQLDEWDQPGFYVTFDDVFSASDGPATVAPSPAHGATGVSILTDLNWAEAAFASGRQLWFGTPGNLQMVDPAPEGTTYDPGTLELNQTYEWRVDQIGPAGAVTGHTWRFTTGPCIPVEDFESYANDEEIQAAWPHNIPPSTTGVPYQYIFVETDKKVQGAKGMRFEYSNQYAPFFTEATRTFDEPQDWTIKDAATLALDFRGVDYEDEDYNFFNVEQAMSLRIEDAAGNQATVDHPLKYAVQSLPWRVWDGILLADIAADGVDLTAVKKLTIRIGDGTNSGQEGDDRDVVYIDNLRLCP